MRDCITFPATVKRFGAGGYHITVRKSDLERLGIVEGSDVDVTIALPDGGHRRLEE